MNFLDNIEIFLLVVEAGSFTQAASTRFISPSSVSTRISELEKELGVRLLHRTTRKLLVTDDGQAVYERFKKIVQDIQEAKQEFSSPDKHVGKVRLVTAGALAKCFIFPLLAEFSRRHPGISLEFLESRRTFGAGNHERDIVLAYGPLGDSSLVAKPLGYSHFWVAGSPGYFSQHGIPRTPRELQRHRCLGYLDRASGRLTNWQFREANQVLDWQPPILHTFSNGESLVAAAIQGLGLVWAPNAVLQDPIAEGLLLPALQDHAIEMEGPYILYPRDQLLPTRVQIFLNFLFEKYSPGRPLLETLATLGAPGGAPPPRRGQPSPAQSGA